MSYDNHSLLAYSEVATIVSQVANVLILTLQPGETSKFAEDQQVTIFPANTQPTKSNAMVGRITDITGDQITISYATGDREGSSVRTVLATDQIFNGVTPKIFTDIETAIDTHTGNTSNPHSVTKTQVGLGNVTNDAQLKAADLDTDVALTADSDTKIPSQKAVKAYADGLVTGLLDDRGNYDASVNIFPATGGSGTAGAIKKGDLWFISVAGTLGGVAVNVGDHIRALTDTPGQTAGNWSISESNLGYTPENQANKDTDVLLSADSDIKYPSQKAIKQYVDTKENILKSIIDDFQTEDWEHEAGGTGTMSYDTSDFVAGAKSLKLITAGSGSAVSDYLRKDISIPSTKNSVLEITLKVSNASNLSRLYVYAYTNVAQNLYRQAVVEGSSTKGSTDDCWYTLRIPMFSFTPVNGTDDEVGYDITRIRIRISDNATPVTVRINRISHVKYNKKKSIVIFTFDDSRDTVYTKAFPVLEKYGFKGNNFNIKEYIGGGGYMTIAQLQTLERLGWCNGLHDGTYSGGGWEDLTEQQLTDYLRKTVDYFQRNDINSGLDFAAYPSGKFGNARSGIVYRTIRKFCSLARGINGNISEPWDSPTDPLLLRAGQNFYWRATNTPAIINASIDRLADQGGVAFFVGHTFTDSASADNDYNITDFETVISHIASYVETGDIEVMNLAEYRDFLKGNTIKEIYAPMPTYLGYDSRITTSGSLQSNNRAWLRQVVVTRPITISAMGCMVNANSGNICMGIYDEAGILLATTGSVACPTDAGDGNRVNLTSPVILNRGVYYLALVADNTTATFYLSATKTWQATGGSSMYYVDNNFPLANLATPVNETVVSGFRPVVLVAVQ